MFMIFGAGTVQNWAVNSAARLGPWKPTARRGITRSSAAARVPAPCAKRPCGAAWAVTGATAAKPRPEETVGHLREGSAGA